ncbi:hypothetical protein [[Clostridium] fimetarium]|uniref:Uncharacterized protein n=1 Tax=[Clostridium] fimetarium TaxID=99656 RepID=A0A1I0P980_9FIRM|nr:hypothetical protein [[Clostridium] fimetarium]SEW10775.1 hypothetical protein SAMN05421659_104259 [[Clostridium] fimetarium]
MAYSAFEGYDNKSNGQNSKEEKWEKSAHAAKWILLSLIIACSLIYAVKLNVQDIILKMNGNSIATEFKNGTTFKGVNKDGNAVTVEYKKKTTISIVKRNLADYSKTYNITETNQYGKNRITAFNDNNGIIHIVPIMFSMISPFDIEKVTVYYYGDDVGKAKALNSLWFWVVLYVLLIAMLFICVKAAYRITFPKTHIRLEVDEDKKPHKSIWKKA